ncbi:urease accessory protein UreD [Microbaculum marinum]|uniref:Urease accessory protein UreD n=1 Tax=Microbaculum marinum TaxID=1764581 RepID=A0AAW9RIG1_9HYPH
MTATVAAMDTVAPAPGRKGRASFAFARTQDRTFLARQQVGYPFHVTRPFHLEAEPAHLATLYLQSASGGIYSGDDLAIDIEAAGDTGIHITSQASTVVHDTRGAPARQVIHIDVGENSFMAFATDPLILFPGAAIEQFVTVRLGRGSAALVTDAFLSHDPGGRQRPFGLYRSVVEIMDQDGARLAIDRTRIEGADLAGAVSPHGGFSASASVFAAGFDTSGLPPEVLETALAGPGTLCGASELPNGAGIGMRILADGGVSLTRALERVFDTVFAARFGTPPSRRRK